VRRGARWALGFGAALLAIAPVSGAGADVLPIALNECSASCIAPGIDDAAADEDASAADDTVALFGSGGTNDADGARYDLVLDPRALPSILVDGLPSPIATMGADTPESPGVSPYAFFSGVIDILLPIDPRTGFTAAALRLFTPSIIGQVTITDVMSNSRDSLRGHPPM
jgi:hypothetical protein